MAAIVEAGAFVVPQNPRSVDTLSTIPARPMGESISDRTQHQFGSPWFTAYAAPIDVAIDHRCWRLSGVDRAIIRHVYRATFGQKRLDARISAAAIAQETGYSQYSIEERMPILKKRGIIAQVKPNNVAGEGALLAINRVELWDSNPIAESGDPPAAESGQYPTILRSKVEELRKKENDPSETEQANLEEPDAPTIIPTIQPSTTSLRPNEECADLLFLWLVTAIGVHNTALGFTRQLRATQAQQTILHSWRKAGITDDGIRRVITAHLTVHATRRISGLGFFDDAIFAQLQSSTTKMVVSSPVHTRLYRTKARMGERANSGTAVAQAKLPRPPLPAWTTNSAMFHVKPSAKLRCTACGTVFFASYVASDPCWQRCHNAKDRERHATENHRPFHSQECDLKDNSPSAGRK